MPHQYPAGALAFGCSLSRLRAALRTWRGTGPCLLKAGERWWRSNAMRALLNLDLRAQLDYPIGRYPEVLRRLAGEM